MQTKNVFTATASGSYSLQNKVYALSHLTNAAFGVTSDTFDSLQAYVTNLITTTLSTDQSSTGKNFLGIESGGSDPWTVAWGPVVYSSNKVTAAFVADNIMTLFYNSDENIYVIAIAGTNDVSTYDVLSEDLNVSDTEPWTTVSTGSDATTAVIANGAYNGLEALLNMQDKSGSSLLTALKSGLSGNTAETVYVAGHSLGGGLAPLLALYMYEQNSLWMPADAMVTVNAMATAGPTFSDANFATFFAKISPTPQNGYPGLVYSNLCNTNDIVPMGWDISKMVNIPFLYDSDYTSQGTPPDTIIASVVSAAITNTFNIPSDDVPVYNNYTQLSGVSSFTCNYVAGNLYDQVNNPLANSDTLSDIYWAVNYGIYYIFYSTDTPYNSKIYANGDKTGDTNYTEYLVDFGNFILQIIYQHTIGYFGPVPSSNTPDSPISIYGFMQEFQQVQSGIQPPDANTSYTSLPELMAKTMLARHLRVKNLNALIAAGRASKQTNKKRE